MLVNINSQKYYYTIHFVLSKYFDNESNNTKLLFLPYNNKLININKPLHLILTLLLIYTSIHYSFSYSYI